MAENALPHPTKNRLAFADEVAARRIRWYNHEPPVVHHTITGRKHTSDLDELVRAGLTMVPPCPSGHSSVAELTPDGMAWVTRARTSKISTEGPVSTSPEPVPATGGAIGCWPPLLDGAEVLTERGPAAVDRPLPWPDFNPSVRVVRCGQSSAHGPHFMDHGPDQPRNCPGTGRAAWDAWLRWAEEKQESADETRLAAGHSTEDGCSTRRTRTSR